MSKLQILNDILESSESDFNELYENDIVTINKLNQHDLDEFETRHESYIEENDLWIY